MGRTPNEYKTEQHIAISADMSLADQLVAVNQVADIELQAFDNAKAVALQYGYKGELTIGDVENNLGAAQRRTVEEVLDMGRCLLVLKELTPHGHFTQRIEMRGISRKMAQKFMSATIKFSKANSSSLLTGAINQTKLLELLVLDDDEIDSLADGKTARGLTLDKVETMSVSELKKALRDRDESLKNKDFIIENKDKHINKLTEGSLKNKSEVENVDMLGEAELRALDELTLKLTSTINASLLSHCIKIATLFKDQGGMPRHVELAMAQCFGRIVTATHDTAESMNVMPQVDVDAAKDDWVAGSLEASQQWAAEQEKAAAATDVE